MKYVRPAYRDRLGRLSDAELLAYARRKYGNPYLTSAAAQAMRQLELKYLHLSAADEQRRRLHAARFPTSPREAQ
ncbi:hypothetical protein [Mycolicibacter senuensis]|uniref:hypothetical protein n=1 Tax=Mycolicibacter senuensis TaxID=386913 RepID=UPI000DCD1A8F|nr:hypothetical protein [Mycolicibacter senuensis]RAV00487.1 hypothetical protein DQP56_09405 [Mycolicibacter senuensis]